MKKHYFEFFFKREINYQYQDSFQLMKKIRISREKNVQIEIFDIPNICPFRPNTLSTCKHVSSGFLVFSSISLTIGRTSVCATNCPNNILSFRINETFNGLNQSSKYAWKCCRNTNKYWMATVWKLKTQSYRWENM